MKKRAGILICIMITLLCACALGSETIFDSFDEFRTETMIEGFSVQMPADAEGFRFERKSDHHLTCGSTDGSAPNSIYIDAYVFDPLNEFAEDKNTAEAIYNSQHYETNEEYQEETIRLFKHNARICIYRGKADSGDYSIGILRYIRNNRMLQIRLYSEPQNGTTWEDLRKITMQDMWKLAEYVSYNPEEATVTISDGEFSLTGAGTLSAGKKTKLSADFTKPEKASQSARGNKFTWSVTDDTTGRTPKGVSINKDGELSAVKQITETMNVTVKAESSVFHTTATMQVIITPAMKKFSVNPAKIVLYTGGPPLTVKAVADPDTIPLTGLTWSSSKKNIVQIIPDEENGAADVLPLQAGETVVTVREPGGKEARMTATVVIPVEDIQLKVTGKAVPYGTVTVKETVLPKTAGNKNVEWSLDVDPGTATIEGKGKIKIGGKVKAGTIITVTCTAYGAPEPVVKTIQIEVIKK